METLITLLGKGALALMGMVIVVAGIALGVKLVGRVRKGRHQGTDS